MFLGNMPTFSYLEQQRFPNNEGVLGYISLASGKNRKISSLLNPDIYLWLQGCPNGKSSEPGARNYLQ
jgi:hypothetical protein